MSDAKPLHLAIIPDGNRRWAKEKGFMNVWKGHEVAVENFRTLTDWCRNDPRVSTLTVWCFSTENWKRSKREVTELMTMLENYLRKEAKDLKEKHTRFVHSGRRDRIPLSLKKVIEDTEELTKNETGFTLHLAVDYGGKDEVVRAVEKILQHKERASLPAVSEASPPAVAKASLPAVSEASPPAVSEASLPALTEETIRQHLDHPELQDIDVILRSSGEQRTSNFFLWQTAYAEWIFSPKYFPDIGVMDLDEALHEYERRKRRFGS